MTVRELASLGGHARAAKLTQKRLSEIGTKAVKTRWRKEKQQTKRERTKWTKKKRNYRKQSKTIE
jgi:hypothetical protein